jgi:hypothetical protein
MVGSHSYISTPDEAQSIANEIVSALEADGWKCSIEEPFHVDAPYATVVVAKKPGQPIWLVEPQAKPSYIKQLSRLSGFLHGQRAHACLYVATTLDGEVSGAMLTALKKEGTGLIIVADGALTISLPATTPSLVLRLDPSLSLGRHAKKIDAVVQEYNSGNRIGAVRDLCEFVEGETLKLTLKAHKKGRIALTPSAIEKMQWSNRLDVLAKVGLLDPNLKSDLDSFRGGRNLFDHPARTAAEKRQREQQFVERMMMGARLTGDLLRVSNRL